MCIQSQTTIPNYFRSRQLVSHFIVPGPDRDDKLTNNSFLQTFPDSKSSIKG